MNVNRHSKWAVDYSFFKWAKNKPRLQVVIYWEDCTPFRSSEETVPSSFYTAKSLAIELAASSYQLLIYWHEKKQTPKMSNMKLQIYKEFFKNILVSSTFELKKNKPTWLAAGVIKKHFAISRKYNTKRVKSKEFKICHVGCLEDFPEDYRDDCHYHCRRHRKYLTVDYASSYPRYGWLL